MTTEKGSLSPGQKRAVLLTTLSFVVILLAVGVAARIWGPQPQAPSLSVALPEPDSYAGLDQAIHAQEARHLERYQWTNDAHQFATVPIERAFEILAVHPEGFSP